MPTRFTTILFIIILQLLTTTMFGAKRYDMTTELKKAYLAVTELRLGEARKITEEQKTADSENLLLWFMEDYAEFMAAFISEKKEDYDNYDYNAKNRISKLAEGPSDNAWHSYTQAEIRLRKAALASKFRSYWSAFTDVKKAYNGLENNTKKYPDFALNWKSLAILHSLLGSLPENYQWGVKLVGLSGDLKEGLNEIAKAKELTDSGKEADFKKEIYIVYAYLQLHFGQNDTESWNAVKKIGLKAANSPLDAFVIANIASRSQRNDEAIKALAVYPKGAQFTSFPFLDYLMGCAKMCRLDNDADVFFRSFISKTSGTNFIKESYRNLSWCSLIKGNNEEFKKYNEKVKNQGSADIETDKAALRDANSGHIPDARLQKARMLCDGAYFNKAKEILKGLSENDFTNTRDKIEFWYRQGRVAQGLLDIDNSLNAYDKTISLGQNESYYFACNACYQAGLLCEKNNKKDRAKSYYDKCLSLSPEEYRNSLHQKAKAGLSRLRK